MSRIFEELPCGCLVSDDGGGGLMECFNTKGKEIHEKCMKLYREGKSVSEIWKIVGNDSKLSDYLELDPDNFEEVK